MCDINLKGKDVALVIRENSDIQSFIPEEAKNKIEGTLSANATMVLNLMMALHDDNVVNYINDWNQKMMKKLMDDKLIERR